MRKAFFKNGKLLAIIDSPIEVKGRGVTTITQVTPIIESGETVEVDEITAAKIRENPNKVKLEKGKVKFNP